MASPDSIVTASSDYEQWLATQVIVNKADLSAKHVAMAKDPFSFMRATYYRWAQLWPVVCKEWTAAPRLPSVGDLHLENFGTWRDAEGRLVWGINDFDECGTLSFANDAVRLATSALLAIRQDHLDLTPRKACEAIWQGYIKSLKTGGSAFVLEEDHAWLRKLSVGVLRNPTAFWTKMAGCKTVADVPADVLKTLHSALPQGVSNLRIVHRQAGLGSLGRPRYTAICDLDGAKIAREAKAIVSNGAEWRSAAPDAQPSHMAKLIAHPLRGPDPFNFVTGRWIVRRLSPHCSRIELTDLPKERDEEALLYAMGWETANVHLGAARSRKSLEIAVEKLGDKWLAKAASAMTEATLADWKAWKKRKQG